MEYEKIIRTAITELAESAYRSHREENPEFDRLIKESTALSDILSVVENKLTPDEYEHFLKYKESNDLISYEHLIQSYIQGAKDCVILLKKLGVI